MANFQRSTPETNAAIGTAIGRLVGGSYFSTGVDQAQKDKCEFDKADENLSQLGLDGARKVEQACGSRHKLACDVACWEKMLSERRAKTAYDCSSAALDEARKADEAKNAKNKADWAVDNACITVTTAADFPDLPHDAQYNAAVKVCNANPAICKELQKTFKEKWPSELTCDGS